MNSLKSIQYYFIALKDKIMVLLLLLLLLKILVKKGSTCNQKIQYIFRQSHTKMDTVSRTVLLRFGLMPITSTLRTKRTFVRQSASAKKTFGLLSTDIPTNQN